MNYSAYFCQKSWKLQEKLEKYKEELQNEIAGVEEPIRVIKHK